MLCTVRFTENFHSTELFFLCTSWQVIIIEIMRAFFGVSEVHQFVCSQNTLPSAPQDKKGKIFGWPKSPKSKAVQSVHSGFIQAVLMRKRDRPQKLKAQVQKRKFCIPGKTVRSIAFPKWKSYNTFTWSMGNTFLSWLPYPPPSQIRWDWKKKTSFEITNLSLSC